MLYPVWFMLPHLLSSYIKIFAEGHDRHDAAPVQHRHQLRRPRPQEALLAPPQQGKT